MNLSQWIWIIVLTLTLAAVITNRIRLDLAALLAAVVLGVFQLLGFSILGPANSPQDAIQTISGFSQPVVITLLALFIITRALDKSGITRWIARSILKLSGTSESRLITLLTIVTAFFSLFINNVAAGALVMQSAVEVSRRTGIKPSKLLIPVAFGSLLGGSATYFTTANIIMSDLLKIATPPQSSLNMLDFTPTGGLMLIAGVIFLGLFGSKLLPNREPAAEQTLRQLTGSELENMYQLNERLWEVEILPDSPVIGKNLEQIGLGHHWGVTIVAIRRAKEEFILPCPDQLIQKNDVLLILGRSEKIGFLKTLQLRFSSAQKNGSLSSHGLIFAEAILSPHSKAQGQNLKEIGFRQRFGLTVVALKRRDQNYRTSVGEIKLALGDSLLLVGTTAQIRSLKVNPDFIVFEPNPADQPVDIRNAILSVSIMLAAIAASIAGVPVYLSMLIGALLTILLKMNSMEEAYQSIEWQTLFVIAGMYVVSVGMVNTGLAELIGQAIIPIIEPFGPIGVAAGAYLLSAMLTQVMGGQITAMVSGPVMISTALQMGVNPQAVAVAAAIGCSASFLTPIAHPVNIMMIAPANYRFSDFLKAGWLLFLINFAVLLAGLALFWNL